LYPHVLAALGDEALRGQDVLDLAGADAEGEGAKGAMGRRVAVAADDGCAGEGEALLGADDVDDALALVTQAKVCDAELLDVLLEGYALCAGVVFLYEARNVLEGFPGGCGDVLRLSAGSRHLKN
jgi:hypothetical protein